VKTSIEKFSSIDEIAGMKIIKKDDKDGVKLYLEDKKTWILVRPSGTEPLLRIYVESDNQSKIDNILSFVK
jgi:phosphomannomutase